MGWHWVRAGSTKAVLCPVRFRKSIQLASRFDSEREHFKIWSNMIWSPISIKSVVNSELEPIQVLVYYDGPRIFTSVDVDGNMLFVYQCDEDEKTWRYIVSQISDTELDDLLSGRTTILHQLKNPSSVVVDVSSESGSIVGQWEVKDLPADYYPAPDVTLSRPKS